MLNQSKGNEFLEDDEQQSFVEGQRIENIQVSAEGTLDIYLSVENKPEDNSSGQSLRICSIDVDGFPVGYPDVLQPDGTYGFSYAFRGEGEFTSCDIKQYQQYEALADQPELRKKLIDNSLSFARSLYQSLKELMQFNQEMEQFICCTSAFYWLLKNTYSIKRFPKIEDLAKGMRYYQKMREAHIAVTEFSSEQFELCLHLFEVEENQQGYELHAGKYFDTLLSLQENVRNSFFQADPGLSEYHCTEAFRTIFQLKEYINKEIAYSRQLFYRVFCNSEEGIITELLRTFVEIKQNNSEITDLTEFINYISKQYTDMVTWFEEKYESSFGINLNRLNALLATLRNATQSSTAQGTADSEDIPTELFGSLNRILDFSGIEAEKKEFFQNFIEHFKEYKPRIEQIPVETKRRVNTLFFEIYEAVTSRYLKEGTKDKALDMFLTYGFMDSELLLPRQVRGLYNLLEQYSQQDGYVYSIRDWLSQIYFGKKPPSVNELGVTYEQIAKERKYSRKSQNTGLTEEGERLRFEIMNMFRTVHRMSSGQAGSYLAVLHNDMLSEDIQRIAVTPMKIRETIQEILEIDYSAFHREVFYSGNQECFKKEIIMKQVIPDIILIPAIGTRSVMWQELSGAAKSTPGRWMVPLLTTEDLTRMLIKLTGQFRWELCRTMMGVRWNDITYNSLTSIYADYIETYKKNKNLTTDAKERLAAQIKANHNNLRNIYTADYEFWLQYEYKGMRKLNKEARSILYRFCPFRRAQREVLMGQPVFLDIANQFENAREKMVKEMENRYAYHAKAGHPLEEELIENLRFYSEM